jgi:hypothetical protein
MDCSACTRLTEKGKHIDHGPDPIGGILKNINEVRVVLEVFSVSVLVLEVAIDSENENRK